MDTTEIIRLIAGILALTILAMIVLYMHTLATTLKKCSLTTRTMQPGMVWLLLIPLFNVIWHFFVVLAVGKSLGNEFRARRIPSTDPEPGKSLGIAMCVCGACGIIPGVVLVYLVLLFIYWGKISGFSRLLDQTPVAP
ncbi:MAG TPA: hypothetical protein VGG45_16075 [Terracidiphilus sp.]|jgi:hypothetical protein